MKIKRDVALRAATILAETCAMANDLSPHAPITSNGISAFLMWLLNGAQWRIHRFANSDGVGYRVTVVAGSPAQVTQYSGPENDQTRAAVALANSRLLALGPLDTGAK